jgi:hypothetical protein
MSTFLPGPPNFSRGSLVVRGPPVGDRWARRPGKHGSNPGRGERYFYTPKHPDRLWGPPSLLLIANQGALTWRVQWLRDMKLTLTSAEVKYERNFTFTPPIVRCLNTQINLYTSNCNSEII